MGLLMSSPWPLSKAVEAVGQKRLVSKNATLVKNASEDTWI